MKPIGILFDENVPAKLFRAVRSRSPGRDVLRVGDESAPEYGSSDEQLLTWCEETDRILVTLDEATIPGHLMKHLAAGQSSPGVLMVRRAASLASVIQVLVLILEASHPDEWRDQIRYIPF